MAGCPPPELNSKTWYTDKNILKDSGRSDFCGIMGACAGLQGQAGDVMQRSDFRCWFVWVFILYMCKSAQIRGSTTTNYPTNGQLQVSNWPLVVFKYSKQQKNSRYILFPTTAKGPQAEQKDNQDVQRPSTGPGTQRSQRNHKTMVTIDKTKDRGKSYELSR